MHWKLTLINHGVSGVWSMDLIAKTWAIYTAGISKDLTETRTVSHGDLFYSRWTWWRQGQYPKGSAIWPIWPDGGRGSIPWWSAVWFNGPDRCKGSTPRGSAIGSTDRIEEDHGYLLYGRWTTTHLRRNGAVNHLVSDQWSMDLLNVLTSSIEHKTNWFWHEYDVYWGKKVRRFCLLID